MSRSSNDVRGRSCGHLASYGGGGGDRGRDGGRRAEHAEREGERRQVRDDGHAGVGDEELRVADVVAQHRDGDADTDREQLAAPPRHESGR